MSGQVRSLRRGFFGWSAIWLAVMLLFLYAPLARVGFNSININPTGSSFDGFTLQWYEAAWADVTVRTGLRTSILLATVSAILSTTIALSAVIGMRLTRGRVTEISQILMTSRVLLPEVIIAAGIATMLPLLNIPLGFGALVIGHVVFQTAFAIVLIQSRAAGLDDRLEDAAADLGATPLRTLWFVTIPDLAPGIWAAALLTFLFSFDDVVLSRLLSSPDTPTLPVTVLSLIGRRISPQIDAIGTLVLGVALVTFVVATLVGRSSLAQVITGQTEGKT